MTPDGESQENCADAKREDVEVGKRNRHNWFDQDNSQPSYTGMNC
jgi:hypothetical protein